MAENKTKPTNISVTAFLKSIEDEHKRRDARKLATMMRHITGARARMWGSNIVGFGQYHYKYDSGLEGDFMLTGFSPRKQALTLYIIPGFKHFESLMSTLGKFRTGRSCLYIKRLSDVDEKVLLRLIEASVSYMRQHYETK